MPKRLQFILFPLIIFGNFILANATSAATCETVHAGYGTCQTACTADSQADTTAGLCIDGEICCVKVASGGTSTPSLIQNLALQVPIFDTATVNNLPEYIATIYRYLLIILIPVTVIMIIIGGIIWITAGGDQTRIKSAQGFITSAISGLIIGLFSYVLLSLVGINALKMPEIQSIEREEGGDLIIIDGVAYSQAEANEKLPAGRQGSAEAYQNMACPTKDTPTFKVYFTNYYTPAYGETAGYASFWCNIGMQCSCPGENGGTGPGRSGSKSCVAGSYSWGPCNNFPSSYRPEIDYCNKSAAGQKPIGGYTIAADIPRKGRATACFKKGCKFTIEGSSGDHEVQDTGSIRKIIGLHMDYYVGVGLAGKNPPSGVYTITVTNPDFCLK